MANVAKFFGNLFGSAASAAESPATQIVDGASKIIGMFKLPPEVKVQLEQQLSLANLDMEKTELVGQLTEAEDQIEVNKQEAASQSAFVAGWRPFIGWVCGGAFAWTFVLQPFMAFFLAVFGKHLTLPSLDLSNLMPVLLGMLGLGAMRTYEKVQGVPDTQKKD